MGAKAVSQEPDLATPSSQWPGEAQAKVHGGVVNSNLPTLVIGQAQKGMVSRLDSVLMSSIHSHGTRRKVPLYSHAKSAHGTE